MKKLKKLSTLLLCLSMVIMCAPMAAWASENDSGTTTGDGIITNNGILEGGTFDIDIANTSGGVLVIGDFTKKVYNNGGLIGSVK